MDNSNVMNNEVMNNEVMNNNVINNNVQNNGSIKSKGSTINHKCNRCGKDFDHKSHYTNHINRKIPCNLQNNDNCNITNLTVSELDNTLSNELKGDNKKEHKCQHCSKIFSRNNVLRNHVENTCKVKNKKQIQCKYCLRMFSRNDALKRHIDSRCKRKNEYENNKKDEAQIVNELIQEVETLKKQNEEFKCNFKNMEQKNNLTE